MLDFNVSPYYDDFDQNKHFHKILFRPGRAIQSREMNQVQTILQDQISKFADNIFSQNTPITGGELSLNDKTIKFVLYYNDNSGDAPQYNNLDITKHLNKFACNSNKSSIIKIIAINDVVLSEDDGTVKKHPIVLIDDISGKNEFKNDDYVYDYETGNVIGKIKEVSYKNYTISISDGVFYIVYGYNYSKTPNPDGTYPKYTTGYFVKVDSQVLYIDGTSPTCKIGLGIYEKIIDHVDDNSLLDPALGTSNFQAPGADRYVIELVLEYRPIDDREFNFIELMRLEKGKIIKKYDETVYSKIDDYFALRNFELNGNFVLNNDDFNISVGKIDSTQNTFPITISNGIAYVGGYRIKSQKTIINVEKSTKSASKTSYETISYGDYFVIDIDISSTPTIKNIEGKSATLKNLSDEVNGSCTIKFIVREDSEYRLYVQDTKKKTSKSVIANAKKLAYTDDSRTTHDIVISNYIKDVDGEDSLVFQLNDSESISKLTENVYYDVYAEKSGTISSSKIIINFPTTNDRDNAYNSSTKFILLIDNVITDLSKFDISTNGTYNIFITPKTGTISGAFILKYKTTEIKQIDDIVIGKTFKQFNYSKFTSPQTKKFDEIEYKWFPDNGVLRIYSKLNSNGIIIPIAHINKIHAIFFIKTDQTVNDVVTKDKISSVDNYAEAFQFNDGQTNYLYDHAKLSIKSEYQSEIPSEYANIIVCFDYYQIDNIKSGGVYCANSYNVTDNYDEIPTYSGIKLNNALDLRPTKNQFIDTINFNTLNILPGSYFVYTKTYNLPRIDVLSLNKNGAFEISAGHPELDPKPSYTDNASIKIKLAEIKIPGNIGNNRDIDVTKIDNTKAKK